MSIPTIPEDQEFLAKLVKERVVHLLAMEGFKERASEVSELLKEKFGKQHGINVDNLAKAHIKAEELKRKAQEKLDSLEEDEAQVSILAKYISSGENIHDLADKYM